MPALVAAGLLLALPACSSTQDVLDPSAITQPTNSASTQDRQPAAGPDSSGATTSSTTAMPPAGAAAIANAKVQFAPIVGTSIEAATTLSQALQGRARQRGVHLTGTTAAPTHVLRGYFTPLVEGPQTTVIFVWDVYDPAGNRVHRISGQQKSRTTGGEGWAAVPDASMKAIADSTIDQLAAWLAGSTG